MSGSRRAAVAAAVLAAGCLSKPGFECPLVPEPSQFITAQIGTGGGGGTFDSDCGDRSAVGVAFTLTRNPTGATAEQVVAKAALRCATISKQGDSYTTGAVADAPLIGGFETNIEGPFFADCPAGQVVVGLTAHIVGERGGLFNSISLLCAGLDPAGASAGDALRVPIAETGTMPAEAEARCDDGDALHGIEVRTGSLLDQLRLSCGPLACARPL